MSTYKGFTTVKLTEPPRSLFDLSHERRSSTRMGKLTPILIKETMPNDTFKIDNEVMLRLAPLIAPIMHRVNVFVHTFFVPNRLLWKDWETFITNGQFGTGTPPTQPNSNIDSILSGTAQFLDKGSLADHLGMFNIPDADVALWAGRRIDLMPFAAYYKCWYDYYRDRNYVNDNTLLPLPSGNIAAATVYDLFYIRNRDWQKDYFTSALPWTQRGNEVLMPLAGTGTVTYRRPSVVRGSVSGLLETNATFGASGAVAGEIRTNGGPSGANAPVFIDNIQTVNLTTSDVSINDLRTAVRLQEWLERNALAGSRYNESIMAHFHRRTSDGRLQRAEYLGGGKVTVKISEVVTTAFSDDGGTTVPPANMAGHGLAFGSSNKVTYNCEEHGFIISILSVMPTSGYMQGAPRMFFQRNTFLDYPWPSFAHLSEQEVFKYELYGNPTNLPVTRADHPVFGYQSRYADWKYQPSSSHGDFRASLDFWHLTRKFASSPTLGATFCTFEDTLQDRVFAVSGVDTLWCYIYNNVTVMRSLPYYGTPML